MFSSCNPFESFGPSMHPARGGRGAGRGRGFGGPGGPGDFGGGGPGGFGGGGPFRGGPGMPWMARWFGQRPTRARRGDIRLGILALLCEEPRNGYQLMQELEARSEGNWRPSPGSVYPCLQQLEDEELVEVRSSTQGKVYQLTSKGKTWAAKHAEELKAPWKQDRGEEGGGDRHALLQSVRQIMSMLGHLSQTGTPKQLEEAQRALEQARKAIGRIAFLDDDAEAGAPAEGPDDE